MQETIKKNVDSSSIVTVMIGLRFHAQLLDANRKTCAAIANCDYADRVDLVVCVLVLTAIVIS